MSDLHLSLDWFPLLFNVISLLSIENIISTIKSDIIIKALIQVPKTFMDELHLTSKSGWAPQKFLGF